MLLKGLVKNYETVTIEQILRALTLMKRCIEAHTEVVYTYSLYFYDDFIELMSRVLGKLRYMRLDLDTDFSLKDDQIDQRMEDLENVVKV